MAFDYNITLKITNKINKVLKKTEKKLANLSKVAQKSVKKINESFKKIKLKQTLILNTKKATRAIKAFGKKIKDLAKRLKTIKMPSMGKLVAAGGLFALGSKAQDIYHERLQSRKALQKVSDLSPEAMARLKRQRQATGGYSKKYTENMYIGHEKTIAAIQAEVLKMGISNVDTILGLTRYFAAGAKAWEVSSDELVFSSQKILNALNVSKDDTLKESKKLLNSVNHLIDTFSGFKGREVVSVMKRTSSTLSSLGLGVREMSAMSAMIAGISVGPEEGATAFRSFIRGMETKMPKLLGLATNPLLNAVKSAKTPKAKAESLIKVLEAMSKFSTPALLEVFDSVGVEFIKNFKTKGGAKRAGDMLRAVYSRKASKSIEREEKITLTGALAAWERLQKKTRNLMEKIYQTLLPFITFIMKSLSHVIDLALANWKTVKLILKSVGAAVLVLLSLKYMRKFGGTFGGGAKGGKKGILGKTVRAGGAIGVLASLVPKGLYDKFMDTKFAKDIGLKKLETTLKKEAKKLKNKLQAKIDKYVKKESFSLKKEREKILKEQETQAETIKNSNEANRKILEGILNNTDAATENGLELKTG